MKAEDTENYHKRIVELKTEIIEASKSLKAETVAELAKLYLEAFQEPVRGDVLLEIRSLLKKEKITPRDIAAFLKAWKDAQGLNISTAWLYKVIPNECKTDYDPKKKNLTEKQQKAAAYLSTKSEEEIELIYDLAKETAENLKKRRSLDQHMEQVKKETNEHGDYGCLIAEVFEKLIAKLKEEHDEHHDKNLEKKSKRKLESACDSRHIASESEMEALILAAEYGSSLKNVVEGTSYPLNRWEVERNEKNCKECGADTVRCSKELCKCICHSTHKVGTTKGMKYARDTKKELKDFSNKLEKLKQIEDETDDLCVLGKIVLKNVRNTSSDKLRVISDHITETKCERCSDFIENHPDFFEEGN